MERRKFLKTSGIGSLGVAGMTAGCTQLFEDEEEITGPESGDTADPEELPELEATFAHIFPDAESNMYGRSARWFKWYVENKTDGRLTIEIVPDAGIGTAVEHVEQCIAGEVQMIHPGAADGSIAPFYPDILPITQPWIYPSLPVSEQVLEGPWGQELIEDMRDELGLKAYYSGPEGLHAWALREEGLTSPRDIEGHSIRTEPVAAHEELVRQLGGTPEVLDWNELYEALDTGVVDGKHNPPNYIQLGQFHEVTGSLIWDGHVIQPQFLWINDDWYQDLPRLYQEIVDAGALISSREYKKLLREWQDDAVDILDEQMDITIVSQSERDDLRDEFQEPIAQVVREEMEDESWMDTHEQAVEDAIESLRGWGLD